jgi:PP-loop superfamily ATP-utilizing enzyme
MDHLLNLSQVKAELCNLNRLDEKREINMASLKRLKEAHDALLRQAEESARRAAGPTAPL